MKNEELRGLFKGIGLTMVICATVFYGLILNYRGNEKFLSQDTEYIETKARELGMIYVSEVIEERAMSKETVIQLAEAMGLEIVEESK